MSMQQIIDSTRALNGVVELAPEPGSTFPEVAWGDHFFYYSPDGSIPQRGQPFATIITKNYPDDDRCGLDAPDRYRVNVHVGRARLAELVDEADMDYATPDRVIGHPLYARQGWIAVVRPGERTLDLLTGLIREAHAAAAARFRG
ncbi:DUF6194 family protein [Tsukamurella paurometabola]|uniref:DUF6194 domain-containing protein n=1 Tax=Tsukamurella paurometabola TaxID=2061 RepID=A0A3P8JW10_TSUPA|nr:DUF6194 family protein [Tsukamurella paurometabola]UEA84469.1 DUF6194 family protein [Tsukamurella paurometabola]VDR37034.1 Uncharacterised protein [Tsukamurella paurometabola]